MLGGTVYFLMGLHINLATMVQCMFRPMVYIFNHLSDQKIKECITAASQTGSVVRTVLWPLQVYIHSYMFAYVNSYVRTYILMIATYLHTYVHSKAAGAWQ